MFSWMTGNKDAGNPAASLQDADDSTWFQLIAGAMVLGLLGIVVYGVLETHPLSVISCALLIGLAAALVGALAGFMFGVPKTVIPTSTPATPTAPSASVPLYQGNTNLEQISDWLTKILVGAGLVELTSIGKAFQKFSSQFKAADGGLGSSGWIVAPALVIAYSVCGFFIAYLWARIYMIKVLPQLVANATSATERIASARLDNARTAATQSASTTTTAPAATAINGAAVTTS